MIAMTNENEKKTTTIQISNFTCDRLFQRKKRGISYDKIISDLLDIDDKRKKDGDK